jgi:hypothetical protein
MLVLNRSAIVVKSKEPFLDWFHAVDPSSRELASSNWFGNRSSTSSRNAIRTTTWPMFCTNCVRRFSKSNWRGGTRINQLGREIGVSMSFCHWFEYQHHSMLVDLCEEPLASRMRM